MDLTITERDAALIIREDGTVSVLLGKELSPQLEGVIESVIERLKRKTPDSRKKFPIRKDRSEREPVSHTIH